MAGTPEEIRGVSRQQTARTQPEREMELANFIEKEGLERAMWIFSMRSSPANRLVMVKVEVTVSL
jgi:hypothetical protein